jgi:hypothetical protein
MSFMGTMQTPLVEMVMDYIKIPKKLVPTILIKINK